MDYYAGVFESVYVLLHPFIKPVSIGREQFKPGTYPSRRSIVADCLQVSWEEIASKTGLPSIAAVDVGLRTMILGLRAERANQNYARKIISLAESDDILPPPEGCFSDLLHDKILSYIQEIGHEWVWVGDEFGTERKLYWIEDLKSQNPGPTVGHCNVFTADKGVLWTTHWDSHFSFLCSSARNLATVQDRYAFEGFLCTPHTDVYWSVQI